jgi:membrane associated rhomboid family serine protease
MLPVRDHLPTRRIAWVTWLIILINIGVFLFEQYLLVLNVDPENIVFAWGLVPARLFRDPFGEGFTVLTSMFLHNPTGWGHVLGNMLFMWIFADNVEDYLGHGRFAAFYLLCGVGAAFADALSRPTSMMPMLGASGAVSGVLAAYARLYPRAPITVLNPVLPLWLFFGIFLEFPAWLVILEYFAVNVLSALGHGASGGVAYLAHVGGFVTGWVMLRPPAQQKRPAYDPWDGWRSPRR